MATITPIATTSEAGVWLATFTNAGLGDGDQVSTGVEVPQLLNGMCVQFAGTWGDDGSVSMQGSINGTAWTILLDIAGNPVTATANALFQVAVLPRYIRTLQGEGEAAVTAVTAYASGQRG